MRRAIIFSLVTLGLSSIVGQVVLLRELMIVSYGNEFFIGWNLACWLFWVALGSLIGGRLFASGAGAERGLSLCHALVAILLPIEVAVVRGARLLISAAPGQVPDLLPSLAYAFAAVSPFCLVLGIQFVATARAGETEYPSSAARVLGQAYLWETAGFVAGGLIFGFLLVTRNEFRVLPVFSWLNVLAGGILYVRPQNRSFSMRLLLIASSAVAAMAFFASSWLNVRTARLRFPEQELVRTRNSVYGNVAVTRTDGQFNFFENGLLVGADREQMAAEFLVHIPLLAHSQPRRVLLIGGGFNGAVTEILKHNPDRVDYVELDPELIATARRLLPDDLRAALDDPRVRVVNADGRRFIAEQTRQSDADAYDVVIVNLPDPGTALINRFFTAEFYGQVRSCLKPDGILAARLSFSPDYVSPTLQDLGACIHRALERAFDSLVILPESTILFIASPDRTLSYDPEPLIQRLTDRGIETAFLAPPHIRYRFTTDRIRQVSDAFRNSRAPLNRDGRPIACFFSQTHWLSSFHPGLASVLRALARADRAWWAGALAAAAAVFLLTARRAGGRSPALPAMAVGGFTLMACEVVILLAFQVFYGYVYHKLSLLLAAFMLGMTAGAWFGTNEANRMSAVTLGVLHGLAATYCAGLAVILGVLSAVGPGPSGAAEFLFPLFAAVIGALVGCEFPLANRLYLARPDSGRGRNGAVYAADLAGSCLGALLISLWVVPVIGIARALVSLALLNLAVTAACIRASRSRGTPGL